MSRRRFVPAILLAALLAALLAWNARDGARESSETDGRTDRGRPAAPELEGRGAPHAVDESIPPSGALPDPAVDGEAAIDPDRTRVRGTVRLKGTDSPALGGRVELLLVKPADWPGSWEALQRLIQEKRFGQGIDHDTGIGEDGTWQTDVPRGVRIARTRVRAVHPGRPGWFSNFLDTTAWAEAHATGERLTLDLEVEPGIRIAGRALDAGSGEPVAGARVIRATQAARRAGAMSGADGAFVASGLYPSDVVARLPLEFRVEHPDYVHESVVARFVPTRGAYAPLTVRLDRGVRVGGVVRMEGHVPRDAVHLLLLQSAGGAASFGTAVRELARTTSEDGGRFAFPPIEPTADATLFVPSRGSGLFGGGAGFELRDLDLRADRTDLAVALSDTWGAALRPHFPDGSLALGQHTRAIVQDVEGRWCPVVWGGSRKEPVRWVSVKPGHAHRIVVFAGREEAGTRRSYRGEVVARFQSPEEAVRGVWVDLAPYEPPSPPPVPGRIAHVRLNDAAPYARYVWQVRLTDVATGEPLVGRTLDVSAHGGPQYTLPLRHDDRLRIEVGLGRVHLRLHVEGYEPLEVRLEPTEPGYAEATLALRPLEDR